MKFILTILLFSGVIAAKGQTPDSPSHYLIYRLPNDPPEFVYTGPPDSAFVHGKKISIEHNDQPPEWLSASLWCILWQQKQIDSLQKRLDSLIGEMRGKYFFMPGTNETPDIIYLRSAEDTGIYRGDGDQWLSVGRNKPAIIPADTPFATLKDSLIAHHALLMQAIRNPPDDDATFRKIIDDYDYYLLACLSRLRTKWQREAFLKQIAK